MSKGIVTLCGSVRFKDEFVKANRELTLAGCLRRGQTNTGTRFIVAPSVVDR